MSNYLETKSEIYDSDSDGNPEYINILVYNPAGQLIQKIVDYDGDNAPDNITKYEYNNKGDLVREITNFEFRSHPRKNS